jgi:hypothetical protein
LRAKLNLTLDTASFLGHSLWKFLSVFPRTVVERGDTVTELQATPFFNLIDFGRLYSMDATEWKTRSMSLHSLNNLLIVTWPVLSTYTHYWGCLGAWTDRMPNQARFPWNDESFQELVQIESRCLYLIWKVFQIL